MSLLDALLLDPAPFNVWIALRTDGLKGSGTASDPYDGGTQARFDGVMSLFAAQSNVAIHLDRASSKPTVATTPLAGRRGPA